MKHIYDMMIANHVPRNQYDIIKKALQDRFAWIVVDLLGDHEFPDIFVYRKDGRTLTVEEGVVLRMFVAGAIAVLAQVDPEKQETKIIS